MKTRVMDAYRELIRSGDLYSARLILRFLNNGRLILGTAPESVKVENILQGLGCWCLYSRDYATASIYFPPEQKSKQ